MNNVTRYSTLILMGIVMVKPAVADITARYAPLHGPTTVMLEIASNGDVRGDLYGKTAKDNAAFIIHSGIYYYLDTGPTGVAVLRAEDVNKLLLEKIDRATRAEAQSPDNVWHFIKKASLTLNGRTGASYFLNVGSGNFVTPMPWAVMSIDPTLAPLGKAFVEIFKLSLSNILAVNGAETYNNMLGVLESGAPLSAALVLNNAALQSVDFRPIASSEFVLPTKPDTLEQARARLLSEGKL